MTLRSYAERKGLVLESVEVRLRHGRSHVKDCDDCESEKGLFDEIHSEIELTGDLTEAQRKRFMEIAAMCPVHRSLTGEVKIRISEG